VPAVKPGEARRLALSLPGATEEDHHGIPSFRVRGKIFATLPDQEHLRVMLDPEETQAAVSANPAAFEELWWGKQLNGVVVRLRRAPRDQLADLIVAAWRRRAPKRLAAEFERDPR
jgi:hypothetical protein